MTMRPEPIGPDVIEPQASKARRKVPEGQLASVDRDRRERRCALVCGRLFAASSTPDGFTPGFTQAAV